MPELPEVETVKNMLIQYCLHQKIVRIHFFRDNLREEIDITLFNSILMGQVCNKIYRRGKYIIFSTDKGFVLFHLGMTGKFLYKKKGAVKEKHTHLVIIFGEGKTNSFELHFVDPRRFGRISSWIKAPVENHPYLAKLGVEPLSTQQLGFYLNKHCQSLTRSIKSAIMDHHIVVGVGNIYACEVLFQAKIHPAMPCSQLTTEQYQELGLWIKKILRSAIKAGGTTIQDFRSLSNSPGYFAQKLMVYGRKNERCLKCNSPLEELKISGRNTWYCPGCQHL